MLGAIAGDVIGSPFEFNSIKDTDFELFGRRSRYTDDSVMTMAVAEWLMDDPTLSHEVFSASITHNHPEGIKGAQATAAAIFMARNGKSKEEIKNYISKKYEYDLNRTCDQIRPQYGFFVSCQKSVPEAIIAFIDSTDYESTVRLAVSLGGDSDTQACIAGGIAEAFYGMPDDIVTEMTKYLPPDYKTNILRLAKTSAYRCKLEQIKRCWKE